MSVMRSGSQTAGFTRRCFLVRGSAASLVMAGGVLGAGADLQDAVAALASPDATPLFAPTLWFEIDRNGRILMHITKAEMGQHVGTTLARIIADELGAAWKDVEFRHVDAEPRFGLMLTGGSWSVFTSFRHLSQAGAAGRIALQEAGAAMLGVAVDDCRVENSHVIAGERRVSFADIVASGTATRVFSDEELAVLPLKDPTERRLIGRDLQQHDIPHKTDGSAVYGIDVELPGMVYACPLLPPTRYGSRIRALDDSAAHAVDGYLQTIRIDDPSEELQGWALAIADSWHAAMTAAKRISIGWQPGPTANVSEDDLLAAAEQLLDDPASGALVVNDGDVDAAAAAATHRVEARYRTHTVLHFPLEPVNAVAEFREGRCHIHAGNQWQSLILPTLAKALGMSETDIVIHQYYLGGGFGRRLWGEVMIPAALAARELGRPVKLVLPRDEDSRLDCVRSPTVQKLSACFDDSNRLTAIDHAAVAGWPTLAKADFLMKPGVDGRRHYDPFSISGADHWYTLPGHRVRAVNLGLAQQTFLPGWLRSVGPGWTGWAVESFMDEIAVSSGRDPIEFRLEMLDGAGKNAGQAPESVGGARRLAAALRDVRERSGWGRGLPRGEALGVAVCQGQERTMPTWIACVAHVAVDSDARRITVRKIWQSIDCGTVVNPDGALAQAEGACLWGVSVGLYEGAGFRDGQVHERNLDAYTPLRMADVPELDLRFMPSNEFPTGLGEPPMIPVAPAIANAVYAATGKRLRDLPMRL